jgi:hypothetical protein
MLGGKPCNLLHGRGICKAKDIFNAESNWTHIDVPIPKNRVIYNYIFLSFLDQFLILQNL